MRDRLDIPLGLLIVAYGMWGLILEFRTLNSVLSAHPPPNQGYGASALVISHRHQELCQLLQQFTASLPSATAGYIAQSSNDSNLASTIETRILISLLLSHLHVSFNDIQLFAGREGEEDARRVFPGLQTWAASREARTALSHAGQIIRYAKMLGGPKAFFAVAVYHASLVFWTYGVLGLRDTTSRSAQNQGMDGNGLVWLDGDRSDDMQRFIALGRGLPCFSAGGEVSRLEEPDKVMNAIIDILEGGNVHVTGGNRLTEKDKTLVPPLVENLSQLIKELGSAAKAVMCS